MYNIQSIFVFSLLGTFIVYRSMFNNKPTLIPTSISKKSPTPIPTPTPTPTPTPHKNQYPVHMSYL